MKLKSIVSILTLLLALVAVSVFVVSCDNASNSDPEPEQPTDSTDSFQIAKIKLGEGFEIPPEGLNFLMHEPSFPLSTPGGNQDAGTIPIEEDILVLNPAEVTLWNPLSNLGGITINPIETKGAKFVCSATGGSADVYLYTTAEKIEANRVMFLIVDTKATLTSADKTKSIQLKKGFNTLSVTDDFPTRIDTPKTLYLNH
ncbi:MAG: hypothetical protein ACRC5H_02360 [Treponemataceae bacterium]